ncbi:MAG: ATP-binding cassette domain-containing protein [Coriobacteriales bacterium]|nr:ATP-binding cassette domain-containing protein [Coriobacteriales bacterium]
MAILLSAKDISVEYPAKRVLDMVTLGINEGDRIGIVGRNGDGKSTLLNVLSGNYPPDSGEVIPSGSPRIGTLRQADVLDDGQTVHFSVVGDAPEYTWAADRETRGVIEALISDIPWEAQIANLSGGQRRRVDLAGLLVQDWDILMLDEPTNHLDILAITWLAEHLRTRWQRKAGALLVITHDRWFLDEVALSMWEVHDSTVEPFEGGFSAYIQQRVERERQARVAEERRQNMIRKELAWLSRGARARSTKPKFHIKAALELIENDPPLRNSLELKRAAVTRLGKQVLELVSVSQRYGNDDGNGDGNGDGNDDGNGSCNQTVIDNLNWLIGPGDRIGILGENGSGKTTLLNILSSRLEPTSGYLKTGKSVKLSVLSQRLEELEGLAKDRVREVLGRHKTRLIIDGKEVTTSKLLERLGFQREHLQSYVGDLSGGQKRRLQLLLILADEPNVLILDEPGNDMDTDMLAVMEDLLDSWPGTLLMVSHDRYLMERVTDDQFALIDGKLRHLPGGVEEYLELLDSGDFGRGVTRDPSSRSVPPANAATANQQTQSIGNAPVSASTVENAAPKVTLTNAESYKLKKQLAASERKLKSLQTQMEKQKMELGQADPSDYLKLLELQSNLDLSSSQLAEQEELWLELSELLSP